MANPAASRDFEASLGDVREGITQGRFPARAFNDQQVFDLEQEKLFSGVFGADEDTVV